MKKSKEKDVKVEFDPLSCSPFMIDFFNNLKETHNYILASQETWDDPFGSEVCGAGPPAPSYNYIESSGDVGLKTRINIVTFEKSTDLNPGKSKKIIAKPEELKKMFAELTNEEEDEFGYGIIFYLEDIYNAWTKTSKYDGTSLKEDDFEFKLEVEKINFDGEFFNISLSGYWEKE